VAKVIKKFNSVSLSYETNPYSLYCYHSDG